jgi:UDP-2-acetamido-3-amino-2,3-dideoxy-glucuronate N-acetyltransferase
VTELLNCEGPLKVLKNVRVGKNVKIFNFVNAYGCEIGDDTKVGAFVEIQKNVTIGARCKISSHSFLCEGVHIGDEVFVGHGVMFINDKVPHATTEDGKAQSESDWRVVPTRIGRRASIGTGAIIMCGVTIGEDAIIGAGAVVTRSVESGQTVAGVPARILMGR